ncbi:MAG: hypothetical protein IMY69_00615 [Bacteroidetes bacterium]|jgi:ABC-type Fe3+ transport system permease subunit|nr:hypothetical protein [Bacteroidota bacterium]MCK4360701.1 hypothetical protein [Bacteroidales bacterium]MCK4407795.1 hypothetical protein [Bacteroidales bacterium]
MKQKDSKTKQKRKLWIVINYLSIILILSIFYTGKYYDWPVFVIVCEAAFFILLIFSFIKVFIKTQLWKMSHTSDKNLDERQLQVMLNSLKYSYSAFTIIVLVIVYGFAIVEQGPIDIVIAACLLYIAHTLPAAIIGWKEKIIQD